MKTSEYIKTINNTENVKTLNSIIDTASHDNDISHLDYMYISDMVKDKINSHQTMFDNTSTIECDLYYLSECYPDDQEIKEAHQKAKELVQFYHKLTGCTLR